MKKATAVPKMTATTTDMVIMVHPSLVPMIRPPAPTKNPPGALWSPPGKIPMPSGTLGSLTQFSPTRVQVPFWRQTLSIEVLFQDFSSSPENVNQHCLRKPPDSTKASFVARLSALVQHELLAFVPLFLNAYSLWSRPKKWLLVVRFSTRVDSLS